ncbi:MAG: hypothetical protein ACE14S_10975 [Candidatus Bathyarchaeia archaeon]
MTDKLECPYGIPEDECCGNVNCRVYQTREFLKHEQEDKAE